MFLILFHNAIFIPSQNIVDDLVYFFKKIHLDPQSFIFADLIMIESKLIWIF